jgi:hypothetical protein
MVDDPVPSFQPIADGVAPHDVVTTPPPPPSKPTWVDDNNTWGPKGNMWQAAYPPKLMFINEFAISNGFSDTETDPAVIATIFAEYQAYIDPVLLGSSASAQNPLPVAQ